MALLRPGGTLLYLLKTVFVEGQDRFAGLWPDYPPLSIYQSASRIPWRPATNGKKTNSVAYAVYIWQKPCTEGKKASDTVLRWFDWKMMPQPMILAGGTRYHYDPEKRIWDNPFGDVL